MVPIKYNISKIKGLTSSGLVTFTTNRIANMNSCSDFLKNPVPTAAEMTTLRDNYQTAEGLFKDIPSEVNKQARDAAYNALINGHIAWIAYAEPIIGSNADQAARFGYPQYATRSAAEVPSGVPPKPTVELTPNPGEVVLVAQPYKQGSKAIFYNWQISEDGGETYSYLPTIGNSHRRKTKLQLGKAYKLRVAYATTAGEGVFSDSVDVLLSKDILGKERKVKDSKSDIKKAA